MHIAKPISRRYYNMPEMNIIEIGPIDEVQSMHKIHQCNHAMTFMYSKLKAKFGNIDHSTQVLVILHPLSGEFTQLGICVLVCIFP